MQRSSSALRAIAPPTFSLITARLSSTLSFAADAELDSSFEATLAMEEVKEVEKVEVILAGVVEVALGMVIVVGVEGEGGIVQEGGQQGCRWW